MQIQRSVQSQQRTLSKQAHTHAATAAAFFDACGAASRPSDTPPEQARSLTQRCSCPM